MILNGEFYSEKKEEYNPKTRECIENTVAKLGEIGDRPLMMLGKIQSGKTKSFIGVISLAFDNGYDLAVVLTKNSNALAKQTTARMRSEFNYFLEEDILEIFDIMCEPPSMTKFELDKKMIITVKKEKKNLPKLLNFIGKYSLEVNKKCLIIDDEADFCSIGYSKSKDSEEFDLRAIANQINELRLKLSCKFIQVTATPYSLYLQPEEINLSELKEIKPVKPADTVIVPYGEGYIGGEYYFNSEKYPLCGYLYNEIDTKELDIIRSSDRRKFKEEEILTSNKIEGLRSAIFNFIVGGCIRMMQNGGSPGKRNNKFSFIIHTEVSKAAHKRQEELVEELLFNLEKEANNNESVLLDKYILISYKDMEESLNAYGFKIPKYEEVYNQVKVAIKEEWINKIIVNSENDIDALLDNSGQLKLRTPLNIFIGGQILDRGITISNLIGFYYGRKPQKMQQDTVLQHSRMYGYRSKEDLSVTRFYTTLDIYNRMIKINEFDEKLREDFENGNFENGVVFISKDKEGKIIPCSPQKILISNTQVLKPGKATNPVGFQTGYKSYIKKTIDMIDVIIRESNNGNLEGEFSIDKEVACTLLEYIYSTLEIESDTCLDKDAFISLIKYLSNKEVIVYCRTDREMSRIRKSKNTYEDTPYNGSIDLKTCRELAVNEPVLMLLKQKGLEENGWRGAEFYWPVLVTPSKVQTAVYSSDLIK